MNTVQLIGRLGADPIVRFTPGGSAVSNFSLAVDEYGKGEKSVVWIKCTAWTRNAETLRDYARKGQRIAVEGRLSVHEWEDSHQQKRSDLLVTVERVTMLDRPQERAPQAHQENQTVSYAQHADEIPF